jgi:hypothetical protein
MKYHSLFILLATELGLLLALHLSAGVRAEQRQAELDDKRALVAALGLTDLAIWTEARYTRHPSQTDLFSAFQDLPAAIEHFPAGSIVAPPGHLTRPAAGDAPDPMPEARQP